MNGRNGRDRQRPGIGARAWIISACWLVFGIWVGQGSVAEGSIGWISEVVPQATEVQDRWYQSAQLPAYLEISSSGSWSQSWELVIIDASASSSRRGRILQVITLPITGPTVRLALAGDWPKQVDPFPDPGRAPSGSWVSVPGLALLDSLSGQIASRSILLFDQPTGWTTSSPKLTPGLTYEGHLLDVVTIGAQGTRSYLHEEVQELTLGEALVRPRPPAEWDGTPLYQMGPLSEYDYLMGTFALDGSLSSLGRSLGNYYPGLNPGLLNPAWSPLEVPEPSTLGMMLLPIFWLSRSRRSMR